MKNLFAIIVITGLIWSCTSNPKHVSDNAKPNLSTQKKTDSADEWEITVFIPNMKLSLLPEHNLNQCLRKAA